MFVCYDSIGRLTVSFVFVLLTQSAIALVPNFFSAYPLLFQLSLAVVSLVAVVGLSRGCRRVAGVRGSAPGFVFFNILFLWGVYVAVVRRAVSLVLDVVFNGEVVLLITGLCRIISSDPGVVDYESPVSEEHHQSSVFQIESCDENSRSQRRVRYCKICKAHIKGFDHHCPAFGNCIGQKNYVLFMALLVAFLTTEVSYIVCLYQFATKFGLTNKSKMQMDLAGVLASGTMLFTLFQILWQGVFLTWHVYCVCFNISTDEWINWKKYPEFQHIPQSEPGDSYNRNRIQFRNPYDYGFLGNMKKFLTSN